MAQASSSDGVTLQDVMNHMSHNMQRIDARFQQIDERFDVLDEHFSDLIRDLKNEVRREAVACDEYKMKVSDLEQEDLPKRVRALEKQCSS